MSEQVAGSMVEQVSEYTAKRMSEHIQYQKPVEVICHHTDHTCQTHTAGQMSEHRPDLMQLYMQLSDHFTCQATFFHKMACSSKSPLRVGIVRKYFLLF